LFRGSPVGGHVGAITSPCSLSLAPLPTPYSLIGGRVGAISSASSA
jgi:hypothetical protein